MISIILLKIRLRFLTMFNEEEKKQIENYLYLLNLTDQQLFHFFKELKKIKKPLIVIFFGIIFLLFHRAFIKNFSLITWRKEKFLFLYDQTFLIFQKLKKRIIILMNYFT